MLSYIYVLELAIFTSGFYGAVKSSNAVKKLLSLGIAQTAIILMYVSTGYVQGSYSPVLREGSDVVYSNPLTHVLMLTAIVVGFSTTCVGLAIVIKMKRQYKTINCQKIGNKIKL